MVAPDSPDREQTTSADDAATLAPSKSPASAEPNGPAGRVGDFELLHEIARGGMGVVYKARDQKLNRTVALKMILTGQLASVTEVARFRAEAEAAANLGHANILPIYQIGQHDGQQFFSMKLVEGGNLADRIGEFTSRPRDMALLVAKLARAVHFAHQRGILHRDLKPSNILIDNDGTPYVTDFGLAKRPEQDSGLTQSGTMVGTPSYMPPEQARAEKGLTTAVDVYSLGAILYEALAGRPPFRAATALDTVMQVLEAEPANPRAFVRTANADLCAIALKCLEKRPENRYESAAALADDLERWLRGEPTTARPPSLIGLALRWLRRNAAAAAAVMALGLGAGTISVFVVITTLSRPGLLFPRTVSPLSLLWWFQIASEQPGLSVVIALATVVAIGFGWILRLTVRPKSPRIALAAAAAAGLIASLIAIAFFGPLVGTELSKMEFLRVHPIVGGLGTGRYEILPVEATYLRQFLKTPSPPAGQIDNLSDLLDLHVRARNTNSIYAGFISGWVMLLFLLLFFVGLALESTWAADYMIRTRAGTAARIFCYVETYPPAAALLVYSLAVLGAALALLVPTAAGGPSWISLLVPLGLGAAFVGLAHTGVIRRWHIFQRVAIYIGLIGLAAAWTAWQMKW
jgi:tRNA A-37 threonylcarbamoyl transferase component Bud32